MRSRVQYFYADLQIIKVMQTIRLQQTIEKDGEIHLCDLPVVRGQEVEVIVLISPFRYKLAAMAQYPQIQAELSQIQQEFATTDFDGL